MAGGQRTRQKQLHVNISWSFIKFMNGKSYFAKNAINFTNCEEVCPRPVMDDNENEFGVRMTTEKDLFLLSHSR